MKIAVVSGSRADYGPLTPVAEELNAEWVFVHPAANSDSGFDSAQACALAMSGAANAFKKIDPEMAILLGDRFEILGAATAAYLMNIPVAHLSGGDLTEGSQDDSMRHSITKLSHLHFATCRASASRIIAMGEEPWRVYTVGCPGIDSLQQTVLLGLKATLQTLNMGGPYYLVAYQPATLAPNAVDEARELLKALKILKMPCVFTTLNSDSGGTEIEALFRNFCKDGKSQIVNMPRKLFLSAMKYCRLMIGNSSSGFYEAPTLQKAFVNIGDRQKGRLKANSIIDCKPDVESIIKAVTAAYQLDCSKTVNPYGKGDSAKQIALVIKSLPYSKQRLLQKKWIHNVS